MRRTSAVQRSLLHMTVAVTFALVALIFNPSSASAHGPHPDSETPGSKVIILFSPLGSHPPVKTELLFVRAHVEKHKYTVTRLVDDTGASDDNPMAANAELFAAALGATRGILYVASHGQGISCGIPAVLVEVYKSEQARDAALDNHLRPGGIFEGGDLTPVALTDGFGIGMTGVGINKFYRDNNTIVHVAACSSIQVGPEFTNVREYFGYSGGAQDSEIVNDTKLLWGRMAGTKASGKARAAGVAFNLGGFTSSFGHHPRSNTLDTVLSPAVKEVSPRQGNVQIEQKAQFLQARTTATPGKVVFDTKMDTTVDPAEVVTVEGCNCDAKINNSRWSSAFVLEFDIEVTGLVDLTLVVHHDKALSDGGFNNNLDGNQDPPNTDHVGPNGDDYKWRLSFVDKVRPRCEITSRSETSIQVTVQDTGSGLASIDPVVSDNATVSGHRADVDFEVGTTDPVVVTATKDDLSEAARVELEVKDVAGNVTRCDPVLTVLEIPDGSVQTTQKFVGIPRHEHYVTIQNGAPGLRHIRIRVNDRHYVMLRRLKNNEVINIDVSSLMVEGDNTITLTGYGEAGSSALVIIADSVPSDAPIEVVPIDDGRIPRKKRRKIPFRVPPSIFQRDREMRTGINMVWGNQVEP